MESELGLGSTFTVRLPATYQFAAKTESPAEIPKDGGNKAFKNRGPRTMSVSDRHVVRENTQGNPVPFEEAFDNERKSG